MAASIIVGSMAAYLDDAELTTHESPTPRRTCCLIGKV